MFKREKKPHKEQSNWDAATIVHARASVSRRRGTAKQSSKASIRSIQVVVLTSCMAGRSVHVVCSPQPVVRHQISHDSMSSSVANP